MIIVLRLYPISIDLIISQKYSGVFPEIQSHLCVRGHFSLSRTVCLFRTYGIKISTTVESVYLYVSVYLNALPNFNPVLRSKINCELNNNVKKDKMNCKTSTITE